MNRACPFQPDSQKWDRVVWIIGAWQYYLSSGDREFLEIARGIAERSMAQLKEEWYDETVGLFRGGSFFNDGIAGYPGELYEPGLDSSFVGDHPKCSRIFCLSTNVLYCEALKIMERMGFETDWSALRENIRARLGTGHLWHSCVDQTWSATGYLGAVIGGIFGVEPMEHAVAIHPCVPGKLADSALEALTLRGWTLNLRLHGWGSTIESMTLDGKPVRNPIPYCTPGTEQTLEITLRR